MESCGKCRVSCPDCSARFKVDESRIGKRAKCRSCGVVFVISRDHAGVASCSDGCGKGCGGSIGSGLSASVPGEQTAEAQSGIGWVLTDASFWALLGSNLLMIGWAVIGRWELATVVWCYWGQSVAIGVLWFCKILTLRDFSTRGVKITVGTVSYDPGPIGRERSPETSRTKTVGAVSFAMHYGLYHAIYGMFLTHSFIKDGRGDAHGLGTILLTACVFLAYEIYSFVHNRKWRQSERVNIGKMMLFPYARIIPMHVGIVWGAKYLETSQSAAWPGSTLVFFMGLKTAVDLYMHVVERRGFGDSPQEAEPFTPVQRAVIEQLCSKVDCPDGFSCYKSEFIKLRSRKEREMAMIRCVEPREGGCSHELKTSVGTFCQCPLRVYAADEFDV